MKIAYLLHSDREYIEIVESINQLVRQGDHVFIMINDNDLRAKIHFVYAEDSRVHISETQEFAQEGDLSLARGTIIQMKEAIESEIGFDYYINLSDGMIPVKPRSEIVAFLEENSGNDFYYVDRDEHQDPKIKLDAAKYYTFTNLLSFPKSKFVRSFTKGNANLFNLLHIRRTIHDKVFIGSPWFMISNESAQLLGKHFDYVSTAFKLSWYPEEMYIPMMMEVYVYPTKDKATHINKDYRIVGPTGSWIASQSARNIVDEALIKDNEGFFAGKITTDPETLYLYETYFDKYNEGFELSKEVIEKANRMVDPELFVRKDRPRN
ncbi:MAG: beta-1,6-N-acetylglucosaminyltransferase [Anaerorhabdus sp.]